MSNHQVLIVGASQGIGFGLVKQLLNNREVAHIYATYRQREKGIDLLSLQEQHPEKITTLEVNVTQEDQIMQMVNKIQSLTDKLHLVINCVGILHDSTIQPEKSLKQINSEQLLKYFQINSIPSILLVKHLLPLLKHKERNVFAVISAKVGSIGDNSLGGWYGYRASKTALNMFMKTASLEYKRKSPQTIIISLHPGTTDTQLSKPFQKNVPPEKLFSPEKTASQLLQVADQLTSDDSGEFFSWDGTKLPW